MPDFRIDNSGLTPDEVRRIQAALKRYGIDPGPVDGILGPRTAAAICAFKRALGFVARPYVGPMTWDALLDVLDDIRPPILPLDLPSWVREGLRIKGWHERRDNKALRSWLASDGHALGDPAVYPWCGDFVETCIRLALPSENFPGDLGRNPYWALNWRDFGKPCGPCLGAVASITRNGGGHVAFAVGQDAHRIYLLGGNQSDTVSIAPVVKSRFSAASWRWPDTANIPQQELPQMNSDQAAEIDFA